MISGCLYLPLCAGEANASPETERNVILSWITYGRVYKRGLHDVSVIEKTPCKVQRPGKGKKKPNPKTHRPQERQRC